MEPDQGGISVHFTHDEALVLSDWLYRLQQEREMRPCVPDKATWISLYRLGGTLETTLPDLFVGDYLTRLARAKLNLLRSMGLTSDDSDVS